MISDCQELAEMKRRLKEFKEWCEYTYVHYLDMDTGEEVYYITNDVDGRDILKKLKELGL